MLVQKETGCMSMHTTWCHLDNTRIIYLLHYLVGCVPLAVNKIIVTCIEPRWNRKQDGTFDSKPRKWSRAATVNKMARLIPSHANGWIWFILTCPFDFSLLLSHVILNLSIANMCFSSYRDNYKYEKVYFWPSNYCFCLVLAIELQNRVFSTIQLFKLFYNWPLAIGRFWWVALISFIYNLVLRS
jgi:hypothetical protein